MVWRNSVQSGQYLSWGMVGLDPPVSETSRSGQYHFWVEGFILGDVVKGSFDEANRARKGADWTPEQIDGNVRDHSRLFVRLEYSKFNN